MYYFWALILDFESRVQIMVYGLVFPNEVFLVLLSISNRPRSLPSTCFPIYYKVIIFVTRGFTICASRHMLFEWSINNEMGGTCDTYGRRERYIQEFVGGRHLREIHHLENLGLDGRITLKWIFKKWDECIDWIGLAQRRDRWQAFFFFFFWKNLFARCKYTHCSTGPYKNCSCSTNFLQNTRCARGSRCYLVRWWEVQQWKKKARLLCSVNCGGLLD
jgi:hypothetical protein